jgi:hypothetical protein
MRIDSLTEQQSMLQTILPTYQTFQTENSDFSTTASAIPDLARRHWQFSLHVDDDLGPAAAVAT